MESSFITANDLAARWNMPPSTLSQWRCANTANTINAFTDTSYITNFNTSATTPDALQLILPAATYQALSSNGTLTGTVTATQLENAGLTVVQGTASTPTLIEFPGGGDVSLQGITSITAANLENYLHVGYVEQTTAIQNTFTFTDSGTSVGAFTQFDHITNYNSAQDHTNLIVTIPVAQYNEINTEGTLSGTALYSALATDASTSAGGIVVTHPTAEYYESGASNVDSVFSFESNGVVDGSITYHNVNIDLTAVNFEFGSTQAATPNETIAFNTLPQGSDMSAFTQFDHITNFNNANDILNISLPVAEFNHISENGILSSTQIETNLESNASINSAQGGIDVTTANGSTSLDFVTNGNTANPWGSITLDGVTLPNGPTIEFGSIQQASGTETITYSDAANGTADANLNLFAFQEFDHLLDFNTSQNTLQINIPQALYNEINNEYQAVNSTLQPISQSLLAQALSTGTEGPLSLNTNIAVVQQTAQYGTGVDSVLEFMTGTTITGTITLHNVSIHAITDLSSTNPLLNHLLIAHA